MRPVRFRMCSYPEARRMRLYDLIVLNMECDAREARVLEGNLMSNAVTAALGAVARL